MVGTYFFSRKEKLSNNEQRAGRASVVAHALDYDTVQVGNGKITMKTKKYQYQPRPTVRPRIV